MVLLPLMLIRSEQLNLNEGYQGHEGEVLPKEPHELEVVRYTEPIDVRRVIHPPQVLEIVRFLALVLVLAVRVFFAQDLCILLSDLFLDLFHFFHVDAFTIFSSLATTARQDHPELEPDVLGGRLSQRMLLPLEVHGVLVLKVRIFVHLLARARDRAITASFVLFIWISSILALLIPRLSGQQRLL